MTLNKSYGLQGVVSKHFFDLFVFKFKLKKKTSVEIVKKIEEKFFGTLPEVHTNQWATNEIEPYYEAFQQIHNEVYCVVRWLGRISVTGVRGVPLDGVVGIPKPGQRVAHGRRGEGRSG